MNKDERFEKVKEIVREIKNILLNIYADRLVEIVLYGSFVNDNISKDSDIDIALILKGKVEKGKEIDRIYEHLFDLELETGELISVNPISREEFENSSWPLYHHIKTKGLIL